MTHKLTAAQQRILTAVTDRGPLVFNGRAAKPVTALEAAGLVTVDWDMDLVTKGNGVQGRWRITVTRVQPGSVFVPCRFGARVASCYHNPRCGWERPGAKGRFGRWVRSEDDTATLVALLLVGLLGDSAGSYARDTPALDAGAKP